MKTRVLVSLAILFAVFLIGCPSDPADPSGKPDVDQPDSERLDVDDKDEHRGGDVDVDRRGEDADLPPACENKCEVGQIVCSTETRYKECDVGDDGCLDFVGATVFCPTNTQCVCGGADEWCDPGDGEACLCIPECTDRVCGPDGCGGECGQCGENEECDQEKGTCFEVNPDQTCEECKLECGEDAAGANCCVEDETKCNGLKVITCEDKFADDDECACWKWPNSEGEDCEEPFQICQALGADLEICACEFLTCENGCCASAQFTACDPQGDCCVPDCQGAECGDDGCGGVCGLCPDGTYCDVDTSLCETALESTCINPGDTECVNDFKFKTCVEIGGGVKVWDDEYSYCEAQHVCVDGGCVCQPNCLGKNCGNDGCGGSCGTCGAAPNECVDGVCACVCNDVWQPVCDEQACETYPNWCEAACAGITNYSQGPCQCGCTAACTEAEWSLGPICGVDGVTYGSFCELKCSDDNYGNGCATEVACPEIAFIGECEPELAYCDGTGCPANFNPVCGTDNKSYWNICCFNETAAAGVDYFCQGECVDAATCPDAAMICSPVCGMNQDNEQVSYINAQVRDCLGGIPLYDAACCDGTPLSEDWVCTDSGGTLESFINDLVMTCVDPGLQVLYAIPTDAYGDFLLAVCDDCQCDLSDADETTALCGSDFNTYANQCALNCFAADNPALSAVPTCDSGCGFMTDECPCPPAIGGATDADTPSSAADTGARGVCGDDGYTYGSRCDATYNGVLVVEDTWCEECEDLCKGEDYAPLCCKLAGMDTGATYPNACVVQNCSDVYTTGACFSGECCLEDADCDDSNSATTDTCNPATFVCDHV